jgi:hypothetical protein
VLSDVLKAIPAVVFVAAIPFIWGLRRRWLGAAIWALAFVLVGIVMDANERKSYDMPGLGKGLGLLAAGLSLVAWLLGRAVAPISTRRVLRKCDRVG